MHRKLMIKYFIGLVVGWIFLSTPSIAQDDIAASSDLSAVAFLEGQWRGDNGGLIFEETWNAPAGGVMTAMARGVREGELAVLEYLIVENTDQGPVLRFKHFHADYRNWEGEDAPITLYLGRQLENDVSFVNADEGAVVQRLRYFINDADQLQSDITLFREGVKDQFSLVFDRVIDNN